MGARLAGRYRLEHLVREQDDRQLYLGVDIHRQSRVAAEMLYLPAEGKDTQLLHRFYLDVKFAESLRHPNLLAPIDYGELSDALYVVVDDPGGRPLSRVLAEDGPLSVDRALSVSVQLARGLREAHAKGLVHRALRPAALALSPTGGVKILGLVRVAGLEPTQAFLGDESLPPKALEAEGIPAHSLCYLSPEQVQSMAVDARTDVYALGAILFEMLSARCPFGGSSVDAIYRVVNEPPPRLSTLGLELPAGLEDIVLRCLEKDPDDRFSSMNQLLTQLRSLQRIVTDDGSTDTGPSPRVLELPEPSSPLDASLVELSDFAGTEDHGTITILTPNPLRRTWWDLTWLWCAGLALAASLGTLTYFLLRSDITRPREANWTEIVSLELRSDPAGAEVFHEGVRLGSTPTQAHLSTAGGRPVVRLIFRAEGYLDKVVEARLGEGNAQVRAVLKARAH